MELTCSPTVQECNAWNANRNGKRAGVCFEARPDDLVWVFAGTKQRKGIVIRVEEERAEVAWGTGSDRDIEGRVVVESKSRHGKALRLAKTTYFYPDNVVMALVSAVEVIGVLC